MTAALRRSSAIVWATTCVLLLALVITASWLVSSERRDAIARADQVVTQTVAGSESELNRALLALDLQLTSLAEVIAPAWRAGGTLDTNVAHRAMAAFKDRQLLFNDAALIAADGHTLAASLPSSDRNGMRLPDGFAARLFAQGVPQLTISDPAISPATTEPSVYLARIVILPDGRRALAVVEVPMTALAAIIAQAGGADGLAITLEREAGQLLATVPSGAGLRAHQLAPPLPADASHGGPVLAPSRLSGVPAIVAARPALYRSLRVTVSLPLADALAARQQNRNIIVTASLALIALALTGSTLSQWQFNRLADAREALARSVQTLDQALAVMPDGFLLCDRADRVVRWNERYLEMFPWSRDVLRVGIAFEELANVMTETPLLDAPPEERRLWFRERMRMHRAGEGEWERDLGNGLVVYGTDRRTADGGVLSMFHDVTAAERRLAQAKANAEAANQAKSQFLATMSHEIRTPLNAVLGLNELMLHSSLDLQQRRHAELIGSSGRLLLALINDILDVSRIESGHMQLASAPFSVRTAAEGVVALMQERALAKGLELRLELVPDEDAQVQGDVIRVQQILFNLVGNAIKFTDTGTVRVTITAEPGAAPRADAAPGRQRYRHRYRRERDAHAVRPLHAGRFDDDAPLRRKRAGPGHHARDRPHDGRQDSDDQHAGRGQPLRRLDPEPLRRSQRTRADGGRARRGRAGATAAAHPGGRGQRRQPDPDQRGARAHGPSRAPGGQRATGRRGRAARRLRPGVDGPADARHGRHGGDAGDPRARRRPRRRAHHRDDRQRFRGGSPGLPRRGHGRLRRQADRRRTARAGDRAARRRGRLKVSNSKKGAEAPFAMQARRRASRYGISRGWRRRRASPPTMPRPASISASEPGSGTALTVAAIEPKLSP